MSVCKVVRKLEIQDRGPELYISIGVSVTPRLHMVRTPMLVCCLQDLALQGYMVLTPMLVCRRSIGPRAYHLDHEPGDWKHESSD